MKKKILIGCGALLLLAVLAGVGAGIWGYFKLKKSVAMDPAQAEKMAKSIMNYEIPGGGVGVVALDLGFQLAIVADRKDDPSLLLILSSFPKSMKAADIEKQIEKSMSEKGKNLKTTESVDQPGTLSGRPVTLKISSGTAEQKGGPSTPFLSWRAATDYQEKAYLPVVLGLGDGREKVKTVFESLRFPGMPPVSKNSASAPAPIEVTPDSPAKKPAMDTVAKTSSVPPSKTTTVVIAKPDSAPVEIVIIPEKPRAWFVRLENGKEVHDFTQPHWTEQLDRADR